jgi:hypothetical protein
MKIQQISAYSRGSHFRTSNFIIVIVQFHVCDCCSFELRLKSKGVIKTIPTRLIQTYLLLIHFLPFRSIYCMSVAVLRIRSDPELFACPDPDLNPYPKQICFPNLKLSSILMFKNLNILLFILLECIETSLRTNKVNNSCALKFLEC